MAADVRDKVVVITGAASGIGRALAEHYAGLGARLVLADVQAEALQGVAEALRAQGTPVFHRVCDVANQGDWLALAEASQAAVGPACVLVNNAGVSLADSVQHMSLADAQWLMNINFWGVFNGCRTYLPQLQQSASQCKARTGGACIVNISSIFAMVSSPTQSLYNASKAAVRAFSDGLREELRAGQGGGAGGGTGAGPTAQSIQVLCVHPGGIQTAIAQNARVGDVSAIAAGHEDLAARFDLAARNTPAYAARVIVNAHLAGKTRVLIGADAHVADWLYRLRPARSSAWLSWAIQKLRAKRLP